MIRRDAIDDRGSAVWILIAQRDHALLAGELARPWGNPPCQPLAAATILLPAIARHDDGWMAWDAAPEVSPETGRPIDFTEMEVETADAIWAESIASLADLGPLAQYAVAGHFTALRQRSASESLAATRFVLDYHTRMERWLRQWQHEDRTHTEDLARLAVRTLQFFDGLSLWLACAEPRAPLELLSPCGVPLTFQPVQPGTIQVRPWPWTCAKVEVRAQGRSVPVRRYASSGELWSEPGPSMELVWRLVPGLPEN